MGLFGSKKNGVSKQILDKASDAIVYTDKKNRISYMNASAERFFGGSAKDKIGQDITTLQLGALQEGTVRIELQNHANKNV